ncbi:hypothetical protein D3C75_969030 [compost metagenome]
MHLLGQRDRTAHVATINLRIVEHVIVGLDLGPAAFDVGVAQGVGRGRERGGGQQGGHDQDLAHGNSCEYQSIGGPPMRQSVATSCRPTADFNESFTKGQPLATLRLP